MSDVDKKKVKSKAAEAAEARAEASKSKPEAEPKEANGKLKQSKKKVKVVADKEAARQLKIEARKAKGKNLPAADPLKIRSNHIRRLGWIAAVARQSGSMFDAVRDVAMQSIRRVLSAAVVSCRYREGLSITLRDVEVALPGRFAINSAIVKPKRMPIMPATKHKAVAEEPKKTTKKDKKVKGKAVKVEKKLRKAPRERSAHRAWRKIRFYQKRSDRLVIPKRVFRTLCLGILNELTGTYVGIVSTALLTLQYYVEQNLTTLLRKAGEVAVYCKKTTVTPADLSLVQSIMVN